MKSRRLRTPYIISSIAAVLLFYLIPYLTLSKVKNLELVTFWSAITLVWIIITNLLLMRDLL
ncbi:MAG: hypothetical protein QN229_06580 [Desulfurococcaceae archaeon TW002]